jgi:hypothetical protein
MPGMAGVSTQVISPVAQSPAAVAAPGPKSGNSGFTFGDFLDIINPLQHIPVISTLYQHLTGDKPGIPEKIVGDTLFGGPIGLASSLADTLFQEITGKNVGDTVYAFLFGSDTPTAVAGAQQATPAAVTPAAALRIQTPDVSALMNALSIKGVDTDTAQRAAYAYRRTLGLSTAN